MSAPQSHVPLGISTHPRADPRLDAHVLGQVYKSGAFDDSKTFVDLPLTCSWAQAWRRWDARESVDAWLAECFVSEPGEDAVHMGIERHPNVSSRVSTDAWRKDLVARWTLLQRRTKPHSEMYTMIPLQYPFIVAGGRFRELYYWDSYFVLRGLLVSGRQADALQLVLNFAALIAKYGFVPNGNRTYYLNRTQPPLYVEMVAALYEAGLLQDVALLVRLVEMGIREWQFFEENRSVVVVLKDGVAHRLSRYAVSKNVNTPRPESFRQDEELAQRASLSSPAALYRGLASAAESGWDFSSRWMESPPALETTDFAVEVVPVCLNVFLTRMETNLSQLLNALSDHDRAGAFSARAKLRRQAMRAVFWSPSSSMWFDWNAKQQKPTNIVAASGFFPLWESGSLDLASEDEAVQIIKRLFEKSGLIGPGGIAATSVETGEQWDFPNGWPPIQLIIIEGLQMLQRKFPQSGAGSAARELADRFLDNAFQVLPHRFFVCRMSGEANWAFFREGWKRHGNMMEKYDVRQRIGVSGGGGEYQVQEGFGWTNGVALVLLDAYRKDS